MKKGYRLSAYKSEEGDLLFYIRGDLGLLVCSVMDLHDLIENHELHKLYDITVHDIENARLKAEKESEKS